MKRAETHERLRKAHTEASRRLRKAHAGRIARDRKELEEGTKEEGPHSFWADMLAAHIDRHGKVLPE